MAREPDHETVQLSTAQREVICAGEHLEAAIRHLSDAELIAEGRRILAELNVVVNHVQDAIEERGLAR